MGREIDLTNQVFGNWQVITRDLNKKSNRAYWLCKCNCGNPEIYSISGNSLRAGKSKSCNHCVRFNMIGRQFYYLTVLELDIEATEQHKQNRQLYYKCQCKCGNIITTSGYHLRDGHTRSCGCLVKEHNSAYIHDLTGQVFGLLTVQYDSKKRQGRSVVWHCICKCGNECDVVATSLIEGLTKSCGCLHSSIGESNIEQILITNNIKYEKEKTFNDLISSKNSKYRYDFYLPDYNRLVEFDGIQHYQPFGWITEERFKEIQNSDKIKNEYAKNKGISLIRIPYTQRNNITLELLLNNTYLIEG